MLMNWKQAWGFPIRLIQNSKSEYNTQSGMVVVIRKTNNPYSAENINAENIISGNNPDKINLDLAVDLSTSFQITCIRHWNFLGER